MEHDTAVERVTRHNRPVVEGLKAHGLRGDEGERERVRETHTGTKERDGMKVTVL